MVTRDPAELARSAADRVVTSALDSVERSGRFDFAVSGGSTPWAMFAELAGTDMPWEATTIYQVDERVAPADDPDRNLAHLSAALRGASASVVPMPVERPDLEDAARDYGEEIPERFDLVHLGLGPDGHTASLVPGDPVLEVTDRPVALTTEAYQGRRRMTLTYPGLARARRLLWLVAGTPKAVPLLRLLDGDRSIPAGAVEAQESVVMADAAAAVEVARRWEMTSGT